MDDVPQFEEGTTTAPEDSDLPKVDTTEEIIWKRNEEELSLRFAETSSKELYLAGLEIKMEGNLTWLRGQAHGMILIRLIEAKVKQLIGEFSAYVKEAIEIALTPNKENLEEVREEQKSIRA
ncbi:hypothetical protein K7X08_011410 [Anisodus acutangulus]|uniref:Uncharacterized protein n=1 Tax=Anisodus acutangulus TaxID=402998 RepID=A0A9Q1MKP8_9SOLA|nr:hypothetical protein K7X08_011410 [Anisodus acutangulus]